MNITYLLGAGASYKALPIVGELDCGFKLLGNYCSGLFHSNGVPLQTEFVELMKEACEKAQTYGTIDTYAKKLSLNKDKKLSELKNALGLFFTIWQNASNINDVVNRKIIGRNTDFQKIDSRYFGLLSNYLENADGEINLIKSVKFVTWNYDVQLEMALREIMDKNSIYPIIDSFSFPNRNNKNADPSIIHLNGIAGLFQGKRDIEILHDMVNKSAKAEDLFRNLLFILEPKTTSHDNYFTFAWENDSVSQTAFDMAQKVFNETDILVIIGYSFPTFNDKIDKRLMNSFINNKRMGKVYIQNPTVDSNLLTRRFGFKEDQIITTNAVDQFLLPLEFMNKDVTESRIEIIKARYGTPFAGLDVKTRLTELLNQGYKQGIVNHYNFKIADPARGMTKSLYVTYNINGEEKSKQFLEGSTYDLS